MFKQSPRTRFGRFAKLIKVMRYKQSQGDHTPFIKYLALGGVTTLLVYVNGIVVTGEDSKSREASRKCLVQEFEIKQLSKLKYFLGIEVAHSRHGIFISQQSMCWIC